MPTFEIGDQVCLKSEKFADERIVMLIEYTDDEICDVVWSVGGSIVRDSFNNLLLVKV